MKQDDEPTCLLDDNYILFYGNCLGKELACIPDNSVDLIVADPPYGTTNYGWDSMLDMQSMWTLIERVIKPRGAIILHAKQPFTAALVNSNLGKFKQSLVWNRGRPSNHMQAKKRHLCIHEDVIVFYDGQCTYNPQFTTSENTYVKYGRHKAGKFHWRSQKEYHPVNEGELVSKRYPRTILSFPGVYGKEHPTQKPVELAQYFIETYSNKGETVMDFCMGSGTTGVAALQCGRKFIGCEKNEQFFALAQRRIQKVNNEA